MKKLVNKTKNLLFLERKKPNLAKEYITGYISLCKYDFIFSYMKRIKILNLK